MRLQGGTRGLLTAISAGRLDELDAYLPEERRCPKMCATKRRQIAQRERRLRKWLARSAR